MLYQIINRHINFHLLNVQNLLHNEPYKIFTSTIFYIGPMFVVECFNSSNGIDVKLFIVVFTISYLVVETHIENGQLLIQCGINIITFLTSKCSIQFKVLCGHTWKNYVGQIRLQDLVFRLNSDDIFADSWVNFTNNRTNFFSRSADHFSVLA